MVYRGGRFPFLLVAPMAWRTREGSNPVEDPSIDYHASDAYLVV